MQSFAGMAPGHCGLLVIAHSKGCSRWYKSLLALAASSYEGAGDDLIVKFTYDTGVVGPRVYYIPKVLGCCHNRA